MMEWRPSGGEWGEATRKRKWKRMEMEEWKGMRKCERNKKDKEGIRKGKWKRKERKMME
jgi:hypothetical protein